MLPLRNLRIPKETEEQLKKLKQRVKVNPNVGARIAFFTSVESGYRYEGNPVRMDSSLNLDKVTWLGDLADAIDTTLQMLYPDMDIDFYKSAWADHVRDGITRLRANTSLINMI